MQFANSKLCNKLQPQNCLKFKNKYRDKNKK